MKLTYELLCRYPNAKVFYEKSKICPNIHVWDIGSIERGGTIELKNYINERWYEGTKAEISECQLILRAVDEMTDDEKANVSELQLDIDDVIEWLDEIMTGNSAMTADYVSGNQAKDIIDYLRSINICTEEPGEWWVKQ